MNRLGHQIVGISEAAGIVYLSKHITNNYQNELVISLTNTISKIISMENITLTIIFSLIYWIGISLPDIDRILRYLFDDKEQNKRYLYHRQTTHSLFLWVGLLLYSLFSMDINQYSIYTMALSLGVLSHLSADMVTGSVPLFLYGSYLKKKNIISKILNIRIGIKIWG